MCRRTVAQPGSVCAACWKDIHFFDGALCPHCGHPFDVDPEGEMECANCLAHPPAFDALRAVMRYDENSKPPILALKHADRLDLAPGLAEWLIRSGKPFLSETDIVVPVPLYWRRLWRRRYNQSAELGRCVARETGKPFAPTALLRRRSTPSQGEMPSAKARRRNVLGAFTVPQTAKPHVSGRIVLLIDDVVTTGATVDACARALKRAGARKVYVLALARVVRSPQGTL